jgi:hypothetical protein
MMYRNASYVDNFENWKYKEELLQRIVLLENAIAENKAELGVKLHNYDQCMVCHQEQKIINSPQDIHLNRPVMDLSVHLSQ